MLKKIRGARWPKVPFLKVPEYLPAPRPVSAKELETGYFWAKRLTPRRAGCLSVALAARSLSVSVRSGDDLSFEDAWNILRWMERVVAVEGDPPPREEVKFHLMSRALGFYYADGLMRWVSNLPLDYSPSFMMGRLANAVRFCRRWFARYHGTYLPASVTVGDVQVRGVKIIGDRPARLAAYAREKLDESALFHLALPVPDWNPNWKTETVVGVAGGMYDKFSWDRGPILADALQDANCPEDHWLLRFLRDPEFANHAYRGMWFLDELRGFNLIG